MGDHEDKFERVRREADPMLQARLASELINVYQQRATELARLRKEAINRAAQQHDMSFSAIAAQLGITRGRISQIRHSAPPAERALFGVGPVAVAVPLRNMPERALPVVSSEDSTASEYLTQMLTDLAFQVRHVKIPADGDWRPTSDTVAICGPKSSGVMAAAIDSDPFLTFEAASPGGNWAIRERDGSRVYESGMDHLEEARTDMAYVGSLAYEGQRIFVVAGIHALGSLGAVDYLSRHLPDLYAAVGTQRFSMVVGSDHEGDRVTKSELVCPPRVHP